MNTGKDLESLINEVEKILLPNAFTIESNKKLFEDGVQSDEFDLLISGTLGTSSISWLIECRDRPSKGTQSKAWIEQLIGRREENKFNKVTAVSSTGFSPKAISLAKKWGIDLHIVEHLTSEDIISWWSQTSLPVIGNVGYLKGFEIYLESGVDKDLLLSIQSEFQAIKPESKILISVTDESEHSILDAWNGIIQTNQQVFDGINPNTEARKATIIGNYPNPLGRYKVKCKDKFAVIVEIIFHADLKVTESIVPTSKILQIRNAIDNSKIDQLADYKFKILDRDVKLTIHKFNSSDNVIWSLTPEKSN